MVLIQLLRYDLHLNVLFLSAAGLNVSHRRKSLQFRHQLVVDIVVKIVGLAVVDGQHHAGRIVDVERNNAGSVHVVRQIQIIHLFFQIVIGLIHICAVLILQQHHGHIFCGIGGHAVNSAQGSHRVLNGLCHQFRHIIRAGSGIYSGNYHHGHIHSRHQLHFRGEHRHQSEYNQTKNHQHRCNGPF